MKEIDVTIQPKREYNSDALAAMEDMLLQRLDDAHAEETAARAKVQVIEDMIREVDQLKQHMIMV